MKSLKTKITLLLLIALTSITTAIADGQLIQYGNCIDDAPVYCGAIGSRSEGWYQEDRLVISQEGYLSFAKCHDKEVRCEKIGTELEGWYAYPRRHRNQKSSEVGISVNSNLICTIEYVYKCSIVTVKVKVIIDGKEVWKWVKEQFCNDEPTKVCKPAPAPTAPCDGGPFKKDQYGRIVCL